MLVLICVDDVSLCVCTCLTYQHRARYMCSLTNTDPESRMYQHVARLSGLKTEETH